MKMIEMIRSYAKLSTLQNFERALRKQLKEMFSDQGKKIKNKKDA